MDKSYFLTIDQGTTSSRSIVFSKDGLITGLHRMPHRQIYPRPGWVSHDAEEIFANVVETGKTAMEKAGISHRNLAGIGITNQRETVVLWDKKTGKPLCGAIIWQCRRTADTCAQAEKDGMAGVIRKKTGLLIDPYFSATKIKWMLEHVQDAKILLEKGRLLAGTVDSYIIWRLTGGRRHVTDYTNASRTMLFNINSLEWDGELLDYFNVPVEILPEVVPCAGHAGTAGPDIWGGEIPVMGIAGDQHAALFGQTCFGPGDVKNTYGTGCFILKNIGDEPLIGENRLLTTLAWFIDKKAGYALEGSVFNAGAAVEWLINEVKLAESVEEINALCADAPDTDGAYFVPAFSGLGAPYWDMYARGGLSGLNLSTGKKHIVRAVMESVAYSSRDVIDHMAEVSAYALPSLKVDGGVSKSDFTMQFQADLLGVPVERAMVSETTALGVFYMAGLGAGLFSGLDEIKRLHKTQKVFVPAETEKKEMEEKYRLWKKAVERARNWAE